MRKEERETETERGGREVSRAAALPIAGNGKASNLSALHEGRSQLVYSSFALPAYRPLFVRLSTLKSPRYS